MLFRPIHLIVGSLALLLIAVIAGRGLWRNFHPKSRATAPYVLVTDGNVFGIRPGSPVYLRGILIGGVRSVSFDPRNPRHIRVLIMVLPEAPVYQGTYAGMSSLDITSDLRAIDLYYAGNSRKRLVTSLGHPARIPIRPPAMDHAQVQTRQAMENADRVLQHAKQVWGKENQARLDRMQQNIGIMTSQLQKMQSQWASARKGMPSLDADVRRTMAQVKRLDENTQTASTALLQHTQALAKKAGATARQVTADKKALQVQWQENLTPDYQQAMQSTGQARQSMKELAKDLQADPQSLLLGRPAAGPDPGEPGFTPESATATQESPVQP